MQQEMLKKPTVKQICALTGQEFDPGEIKSHVHPGTHPYHSAPGRTLPYLQDEGRAGLQLQHPRGAERLEDRVWVVHEVGGVDDQQGLDIIHDEANLIRAIADLRRAPLGVVDGGRVADHGGVVVDSAVLQEAWT